MSVFRSTFRSKLMAGASLPPVSGEIVISLSGTKSVLEGTEAGVTVGSLSINATGTWTFSLTADGDAGDRLIVDGVNVNTTSTPFDYDTATNYDLRFRAVRASDGKAVEQVIPFAVLDAVTLVAVTMSDVEFSDDIEAGTELWDLGAMVSGEDRSLSPNDGRWVFNSDKSAVVKGIGAWSAGAIEVSVIQTHPSATNSPIETKATITITEPTTAPVLQNVTVNMGEYTNKNSGAVFLKNLGIVAGGGPITSFTTTYRGKGTGGATTDLGQYVSGAAFATARTPTPQLGSNTALTVTLPSTYYEFDVTATGPGGSASCVVRYNVVANAWNRGDDLGGAGRDGSNALKGFDHTMGGLTCLISTGADSGSYTFDMSDIVPAAGTRVVVRYADPARPSRFKGISLSTCNRVDIYGLGIGGGQNHKVFFLNASDDCHVYNSYPLGASIADIHPTSPETHSCMHIAANVNNCSVEDSEFIYSGRGVSIVGNNNRFLRNTVRYHHGDAVQIGASDGARVLDNTFMSPMRVLGSADHIDGTQLSDSVTITDCEISGNLWAQADGNSGQIGFHSGATAATVLFKNNVLVLRTITGIQAGQNVDSLFKDLTIILTSSGRVSRFSATENDNVYTKSQWTRPRDRIAGTNGQFGVNKFEGIFTDGHIGQTDSISSSDLPLLTNWTKADCIELKKAWNVEQFAYDGVNFNSSPALLGGDTFDFSPYLNFANVHERLRDYDPATNPVGIDYANLSIGAIKSAVLTLLTPKIGGLLDRGDGSCRGAINFDGTIKGHSSDPVIEVITPPSIAGGVTEGSVLTATPATFSGEYLSITGQWHLDGEPVEGADSLFYTRLFEDIGKVPTYVETATNVSGSVSSTSNALPTTVNGLLARLAPRGDTTMTADRWVAVTNADQNTPLIERGGYTFRDGNGPHTTSSNSASYPEYLRGVQTMSGSGAHIAVKVPADTPLKLRVALGALSNGSPSTNVGVKIHDGVNTTTPIWDIAQQTQTLGNVLQYDGTQIAAVDWQSQGKWLDFVTTTGWVYFSLPTGGGVASVRAVEVAYPSFGAETFGIGPYYVDNVSGNDLTGDGSEAKPWRNIPGEPSAGPAVAAFDVLPGGVVRLKGGTTPYRLPEPLVNGGDVGVLAADVTAGALSFTCTALPQLASRWAYLTDASGNVTEVVKILNSSGGGVCNLAEQLKFGHPVGSSVKVYRENFFRFIRSGTESQKIRYESYGGERATIDGSEVIATTAGVTSGEVFGNPNFASIRKGTITFQAYSFNQALHEGLQLMYPAQFPRSSDPGSYNKPYSGTDAFVDVREGEMATQMVVGAPDSASAGYKLCVFTSPVLAARYGPDNVNIAGWPFVGRVVGNRLEEFIVTNHVPATGRIEFSCPNVTNLQTPTNAGQSSFLWCVRFHPYDLIANGQFAWSSDKKIPYWLPKASDPISISRIEYVATFDVDHIEFESIDFRGFGIDYGGLFRDNNAHRVGSSIRNSKWYATLNSSGNGVFRPANSNAFDPLPSEFELENIDGFDTSLVGLCQSTAQNSHFKGIRHRDAGRTSIYFGKGANNLVEDFDLSDNASVHGNGASNYLESNHNTLRQGYIMNHPLAYSAQRSGVVIAVKANKLINTVVTARPPFAGTTNPVVGISGPTLGGGYTMQVLDGETQSLFEGVVSGGRPALMGGSLPGGDPSTGQIIRNCVFSSLLSANMEGRILQNVLILRQDGLGLTEFAGLDPSSYRIDIRNGETSWDGTITEEMQKVLTRNGDTETFLPRILGPKSGPGANPWYIPAWGEAHELPLPALTTNRHRAYWRVGDSFTSIVCTGVGVTLTLPAGLGDNALFGYAAGTLHWLESPPPGVYQVAIKQTSTHPDLTGVTERTDLLPITVV